MLTKTDIKKLKKIFGTKKNINKDINKAINKAVKEMNESFVREIKLVLDVMDEHMQRMDARFEKMDKRFEKVDARFEKNDEKFERIHAKIDETLDELKANRIVLGNHENRLQTVEKPVFSQA